MLRHGGGAVRRALDGAGALAKIDAAFAMNAYGVPTSPSWVKRSRGHFDLLRETMEPSAAPGGFFNMTERPAPLEEILPPEACDRLAEVKRRWDPRRGGPITSSR